MYEMRWIKEGFKKMILDKSFGRWVLTTENYCREPFQLWFYCEFVSPARRPPAIRAGQAGSWQNKATNLTPACQNALWRAGTNTHEYNGTPNTYVKMSILNSLKRFMGCLV